MRLDVYLCENGFAASRTEAKKFILSGSVSVNGRAITKPAFEIEDDAEVSVDKSSKKYVSRGGLKLEAALDFFNVDVKEKLAIDIGASSGGFTDCLLQRGAKHVIAVDSGTMQLVSSLRDDERVTSKENFNARYMSREDLEYIPEIAVMDVSFISATYIIRPIYEALAEGADFICLIKPQFEVGKSNVGKGGIVKSEVARLAAVEKVISYAKEIGFKYVNHITSPIIGGDGNTEYLAHFKKQN
ncbi:MAG: TlyA family RNA methyltransferase [Ruminococcaceae bacterium]|nr:TlyA family RNA methyltransferase [Oscillospiraceae bacterium]